MTGRVVWGDRYELCEEVATGGMATVYLAVRLGSVGEGPRVVALKKLAPELVKQPDFVAMFFDEAHLSARIRHPNVVVTHELLRTSQGLAIVMELIVGLSLAELLRTSMRPAPLAVAAALVTGALDGLHAAHEVKDDTGRLLGLVHRDVSPHNILVGRDGVPRVIDFGVAKASGRLQVTDVGVLKGKFAYMAPEQIRGAPLDRRADVYAAGIVFWETLTRRKLFQPVANEELLTRRAEGKATLPPPSTVATAVPTEIDDIILRALRLEPDERFPSAHAMAEAIRRVTPIASPAEVASWVGGIAGEQLATLETKRAELEGSPLPTRRPPPLVRSSTPPPIPSRPPVPVERPRVVEPARPRPSPRRTRSLGMTLVALCALGLTAAAVLRGPGFLKGRLMAEASRRGLQVSARRLDLRSSGVALMDVAVAFAGCPEVTLMAGEVDVRLDWRGQVETVSFTGFDLVVHGSAATVIEHWKERPTPAVEALDVTGTAGHLLWRDGPVPGATLEALDVSLQASHADVGTLDSANLLVGLPSGHLGPWGLHVGVAGRDVQVAVALDPSSREGPPIARLVSSSGQGTSLSLDIPRDTTFKIGVPAEVLGLTSVVTLEASLAGRSFEGRVDGKARVGLYGIPVTTPAGVTPVDVVVEGAVRGAAGVPLAIEDGKLMLGEAVSPLAGVVTLEPDGARIVLDRPTGGHLSTAPPAFVLDTRAWASPSAAPSFGHPAQAAP